MLEWLSYPPWVEHVWAASGWHMGGRTDNNESCGRLKIDTTERAALRGLFGLVRRMAQVTQPSWEYFLTEKGTDSGKQFREKRWNGETT